jgi:uncharacterized protein (TIGR02466 family)
MSEAATLFVTKLYRAAVEGVELRALAASCRVIAAEDEAGKRWSEEKGYSGYTSYASLDDLPKRDPEFSTLARLLDKHAAIFARALLLDLRRRML